MKDDAVRNSIIATVAAIPYVGGTISFFLDKYIPSESEQKKDAYIKSLSTKLDDINQSLKIENLDTPEFKSIFIKLLRASIDEYRNEKIEAYKNLTVRIALQPYEFNKIDFYTRMVISLVPDAIMLLYVFYRLDVKHELDYLDSDYKRDISRILINLDIEMDEEYRMSILSELNMYRLVLGSMKIKKEYGREGLFLSDLGKDFTKYIFE